MPNNPFSILPTPEHAAAVLRGSRPGEEPIYTQMARDAGSRVRAGFAGAGMPFTPEDARAVRGKKIMEDSQKRYAELVADGKMTTDDAQAAVLEEAIRGFSAAGDWQQALALTEPLNEIKKQVLERRKLKAEAVNLESKPDAKEVDQQIKLITAQQQYDAKMAALELAEQRAQTAAERAAAQNQLNALQGEFLL